MKTIVLIALILACSMAVTMKRPMSNAQIQKYESLKKGNKWASIMMNLAELSIMSQGPLDTLVDAIEEVVADLDRKIERAHSEYADRTVEHNSEVSRITSQINNANTDISSTTEFLNNVLYVQRENLTQDIANLERNIERTHTYIAEQTTLRRTQHDQFNQVITEHGEALEAVHEALQILSQLNENGTSLLQVKKAQKSLQKVQEKINRNVEGTMVKALLALTAGEFANSDSIRKVQSLLNEVATNLSNSIEHYTQEEASNQQNFETDVENKNREITQMSLERTDKIAQLEQTNESIAYNEEFLVQRQRDLVTYEADLVQENEHFVRVTAMYEDLVSQLTAEYNACHEALDVLNGADIAGYIGGRMEQDVIIDQPHGTGIKVEGHRFGF